MEKKDINIMAPAGNFECLHAAIQGGADSVYFGVERLNMRSHSANNFRTEDLHEICGICREHGVQTYLTLNIVLYDEDLEDMRRTVDAAREAGVTAIIASDMAAIMYARQAGVEVHISTQLSISNSEALRFYAQYADVIVLARELNLGQVKEIKGIIDRDGIKAASMNRELSSLKSFFRFLRSRGAVSRDIFSRIGSLKASRRLPAFVPESRMETVLDNLREENGRHDFKDCRDSLAVLLLYSCGIRLAELCGIRRCDITDDFASLKVRGKGDKERMIPLLEETAQRIRDYLAAAGDAGITIAGDSPLILSDKGTPLSRSTIQRIVERELRAAGVQGRKSPHVLRHTFATELLNRDADMRDIQELMGHSSLKTTQNYTHNSIAGLQRVYAKAHPHK